MPSTSLERRGLVVTEIDKVRSSALVCNNMRVKVVLPAPDGDDKISISPRRGSLVAGGERLGDSRG